MIRRARLVVAAVYGIGCDLADPTQDGPAFEEGPLIEIQSGDRSVEVACRDVVEQKTRTAHLDVESAEGVLEHGFLGQTLEASS